MINKIKEEVIWYRKCRMIVEYHELMKTKKIDKRNHKWRLLDTSRDLNLSIGYISESIRLNKAIEEFPFLMKLSRKSTLSYLKRR